MLEKRYFYSLLGLNFGEPVLVEFLSSVGITKMPKIPRDDTETRDKNPSLDEGTRSDLRWGDVSASTTGHWHG